MPASRPFGPSATSWTSGGPGNEVKMTSDSAASVFGLSAHTAPAARWRSAAARRMSCTTSSYPAFCKLAAMLAPIVPSPIKPTFILNSPSLRNGPSPAVPERGFCGLPLREHVLGNLRRGHRRRPAGVESEMGDNLADLLLGDAVVE